MRSFSQASRVLPSLASTISSRSSSDVSRGVSRCATFWCVSEVAAARAQPISSINVTRPGRITFAEIR